MSKEMMCWYGKPITSNMSKKELIEIIVFLGKELGATQGRASLYLSVADPVKLIGKKL